MAPRSPQTADQSCPSGPPPLLRAGRVRVIAERSPPPPPPSHAGMREGALTWQPAPMGGCARAAPDNARPTLLQRLRAGLSTGFSAGIWRRDAAVHEPVSSMQATTAWVVGPAPVSVRSPVPESGLLPASADAAEGMVARDLPGEHRTDDLALFAAVLGRYDFADYTQIAAIRAAPVAGDSGLMDRPVAMPPPGKPAAQPTPGPRLAAALSPDPAWLARPPRSDHPPLSRYRAQMRDARPDFATADGECPFAAARFAAWYASEGADHLRGSAPVDPALAAFLTADAADPWQRAGRQTRLMAALPAFSSTSDAPLPGHGPSAARLWLEAADRWRGLDAALVPDWVEEALLAVGPAGLGAPFPLGAWLVETHAASSTYAQRYDIATPVGRVAFAFDVILHHAPNPVRRLVLNQALVDWFAGPLDAVAGAPSRMEVLIGQATGWLAIGEAPTPEQAAALRRAVRGRGAGVFPVLAAFSTLEETAWRSTDTALEVIGMAASGTGLGQNLWMSVAALTEAGIAPVVRDSEAGLDRLSADAVARGVEQAFPARGAPAAPLVRRRPSRKAALIHLNADAASQILCQPLIDRHPDLHAIGFLLWELEALPRCHQLSLDLLDEIWCPTRYLTDIYAAQTDTPVYTVGKAISLPRPAAFDRQSLGIDPRDRVFLVSFDFHSSVERKNPLAALKAFHRAFGAPEGGGAGRGGGRGARAGRPRLIFKTTPPVAGHWGDPNTMWPAIAEAAARDDRIVILDKRLPFPSLLGLIQAADALVSPHRGEGFGYMPAYALALGRPVIATDYGGSRDFLTAETAYPVTWAPRAVAPGETILPLAGAFWADIDVDALAEAMLSVAVDPSAAAGRAAAGRCLIETEYSRAALARRYRERLVAAGILGGA